jgi:signal transduction histidine kinase
MKLRTKLLLAQLPLALALLVIGALAVSTIGRLGGHSQAILKDNYRSVLAAQRMKESIERMDSAALFKLAGHWDEGAPMAAEHRKIFETELRVEEGNITEAGEADAAGRLRAQWNAYQARYDGFVAQPDLEQSRRLYFGALYPLFRDAKRLADQVLDLNQDAMVRKSDRVRQIAARMNAVMLASTLAAALAGMFASIMLTRRLLRPLSVLSQATRRLGEGDLAARAQVDGHDEIALLAGEFNAMAEHLEKYRRSSLGELFQAQQATQAAIDSLPDPVVIFDLEGRLLNVNAASERLLGLVLSLDRSDPLSRLPRELADALEKAKSHVLGGKGAFIPKSFDEAVRLPLGEGDRWFLLRAHPLYGEEEGIMGATVLLQDVTRLRRFDELKIDLVSTVAHELRTPLTSLHMAIHLCLDETVGGLNEKQADLLYAAREDCQRLQAMVDDLLDLSRIQSGRVEMKRQPVSARSLLESAVNLHQAAATEKGIRLAADPQALPDAMVNADPERIGLAMTNLIANAIRHSDPGGAITLRARPQGDRMRFEVSDAGEGIAPEYHARVFDKFFRVPDSRTSGVGLGLSICREVIEAHGGEIGVQSRPGQGSTFWFCLPLKS